MKNVALDDIETLLDSIADTSKMIPAFVNSAKSNEDLLFPPMLPLRLVEQVANSIYTNRSFPSTTPRGGSTRRGDECGFSRGTQCDDFIGSEFSSATVNDKFS